MDLTAFSPPAGKLTKALRVMKLTAILLLAVCLQVSAKGKAQTVTLSVKDVPLEKVFQAIEKQTGYLFWYNNALLQRAKKVSIQLKNVTLEQALRECFKDQPLSYTIVNKTIVIKPATHEQDDENSALPPVDVKGRVVNENGEPIAGATIAVKGTKIATASNSNGEFALSGLNENSIIVVSSVGYQSQEIRLAGSHVLLIHLTQSISKLDEIKIIGYGTTTQRFGTGSVVKVKSEEISRQPVANPLASLQGRVTGLFITQTTGVPGGEFTVRIRGQNSITNGNEPLYIVDGVPFTSTSLASVYTSAIIKGGNPLSTINPSSIESIEVLKDADATAIYGSRGANGVILISTKKGQAGKTNLDVNFYTGAGKVTNRMELLNTQQYLEMRKEAFANEGVIISGNSARDLVLWDSTRYTDWQKLLFGGTARVSDARVSLTGGNAKTKFMISGGYYRETTVFPGDFSDHKISGQFSISHKSLDERLNVNFGTNYLSDNNNLTNTDPTFSAITGIAPNAPELYDSLGNLNWGPGSFTNPMAPFKRKYKASTSNFITNAVLSYRIVRNLEIKANIGYTQMQMDEISTQPKSAMNPASTTQASAIFANNSIKTWIAEPQAEYEIMSGKSRVNILAGMTFQKSLREGKAVQGSGYNSDALLENIRGASAVIIREANYADYRYNAVFGRFNYNYDGKYLLNLTARRDGSSRFGPSRQFANFEAVGLGWVFSREKFIQNSITFLSFGKLRGSYGITGNDQIGDYGYLDTYAPASLQYQNSSVLVPTRLYNPDYGWETTRKLEIALELGFLRDRIVFEANYYRNRSNNQLVGYSLPLATGFSSIQDNLDALVQNTGLELQLSTVNMKRKGFSWSSSVNITIPRNKLMAFPNIEETSYATSYIVGQSLFSRLYFHYIGIDQQTGVYLFEDVDGSGNISSPGDRKTIKEVSQKYYGGLQNTVQFKGIEINFLIQFVNQTALSPSVSFRAPGLLLANQPVGTLDRWRKPGDNAPFQRYTMTSGLAFTAYTNLQSSDFVVTDGSFLRLKNLSVSYQIPEKLRARMHVQNCRIYIQGQNLLTISDYSGLDPENQTLIGIPPLKVFTTGIQLTF